MQEGSAGLGSVAPLPPQGASDIPGALGHVQLVGIKRDRGAEGYALWLTWCRQIARACQECAAPSQLQGFLQRVALPHRAPHHLLARMPGLPCQSCTQTSAAAAV